jgi:hypothetical protein
MEYQQPYKDTALSLQLLSQSMPENANLNMRAKYDIAKSENDF